MILLPEICVAERIAFGAEDYYVACENDVSHAGGQDTSIYQE